MSNLTPYMLREQLRSIVGNDRKALQGFEDVFSRTTGTFAPTLYGSAVPGAVTYTTREGRYTKVANRILGSLKIVITARGGLAGDVRIGDLPYDIADTDSADAAVCLSYVANLALGANDPLFGCGLHNTRNVALYRQAVVGAPAALVATDITDTFEIRASFQYEIDP